MTKVLLFQFQMKMESWQRFQEVQNQMVVGSDQIADLQIVGHNLQIVVHSEIVSFYLSRPPAKQFGNTCKRKLTVTPKDLYTSQCQ